MLKYEELNDKVQSRIFQSEMEAGTITLTTALESYYVHDDELLGPTIDSHPRLNDVLKATGLYVGNLLTDVEVVENYYCPFEVDDIIIKKFYRSGKLAYEYPEESYIINEWLQNHVGDLCQVESALEDIGHYSIILDTGWTGANKGKVKKILKRFRKDYTLFKDALKALFVDISRDINEEAVMRRITSRFYDEHGFEIEPATG